VLVAAGYGRAQRQLFERACLGEQESLTRDATELEERGNLGFELDAFRHRVQSECLAQRDDGAGELGAVVGIG
jgi:hypothetical protein